MRYIEADEFFEDPFVLRAKKARKNSLPKFKPFESSDLTHESPMHIAAPQAPIPVYVHTLENLRELAGRYESSKSSLITEFIIMKGPEAVRGALKKDGLLIPAQEGFREGNFNGKWLATSTGVIFERLAHYALKSHNNGGGFLLDPGSCSRIFSTLHNLDRVDFTPDGMEIDFTTGIPEIKSLMEYKSNPKSDDGVHNQIARMADFLEKNSGKTISLNSSVQIDSLLDIRASRISVSPNAEIKLVIPSNRKAPEGIQATVVKTPFNSTYLSNITHATLQDIIRAS